jgi:multidrug efflux pump
MSVSLVAVFLPLLLMGGVVGRLFREFAVTLSVAVGISLVVSLTTTAMMCGAILRPHGGDTNRIARGAAWVLDTVTHGYERTLGWALRHPRTMLVVTIATVGLNVWLFTVVPKGFFPQQDAGRLTGSIVASQDISFQAMQQKVRDVVDVIRKDPAVDNVIAFTGGGGGNAKNTARMFVALKPRARARSRRRRDIARLRPGLATSGGRPSSNRPGPPRGRTAGSSRYQYTPSV